MVFLDRNTQTKILLHHEFQNQFSMQKFINVKQMILLIGLLMPTVWCSAINLGFADGLSGITINYGTETQGEPKGSAIHASINGHLLIVVFTENLGQISIEVATATGMPMDCLSTQTPNGVNLYVPHAGDYIITFTLPNGDEYYGEFTVTD